MESNVNQVENFAIAPWSYTWGNKIHLIILDFKLDGMMGDSVLATISIRSSIDF